MMYWDILLPAVGIAGLLSVGIVFLVVVSSHRAAPSSKRPTLAACAVWLLCVLHLVAASSFVLGPLGFLMAIGLAGFPFFWNLLKD